MENRNQRNSCSISTELLRHFRDDLNRYDIKILSKDDVQFQSFTSVMVIRNYWLSFIETLSYSVYFYNCKVFGFWAMNEHVNLMAEQYEFGSDKDSDFITSNCRISKNVQGGGLQQRNVDVKTIKQYAQPYRRSIVQRILEMHSKQWKILLKATSKQGAR